MTTPAELQAFIRARIPVADFMQVHVRKLEPNLIEIQAPLAPNSNVHGTLYAGSSTAIGMIAVWSLVYLRMQEENLGDRLVVLRQNTTYIRPVAGDLTLTAQFATESGWKEFAQQLKVKGRARVAMNAAWHDQDQLAGKLDVELAANFDVNT